jgi:hypothetical protein
MRVGLTFTSDGKIRGEGIDDIAAFTIDGLFNAAINEANWTKSYIAMHRVEYRGLYNQRSICGNWTLAGRTGGFWIWPEALEDKESIETEVEAEQPSGMVLVRGLV